MIGKRTLRAAAALSIFAASCAGRGARPGPAAAFDEMVAASGEDGAGAVESRISRRSQALLEEYLERAIDVRATNLPANPTEVLAAQLAGQGPKATGEEMVAPDTAWVDLVYASGVPARLRYVREGGEWRFDLAREMEAVVEQLREAEEVLEVYGAARREGRAVKRMWGDDDD